MRRSTRRCRAKRGVTATQGLFNRWVRRLAIPSKASRASRAAASAQSRQPEAAAPGPKQPRQAPLVDLRRRNGPESKLIVVASGCQRFPWLSFVILFGKKSRHDKKVETEIEGLLNFDGNRGKECGVRIEPSKTRHRQTDTSHDGAGFAKIEKMSD